jgi:hypothetical protein
MDGWIVVICTYCSSKRGSDNDLLRVGPPIKVHVEQVSITTKWSLFKTIVVDSVLPEVLNEAGKRGMSVVELFNPPDTLFSELGEAHTQLQV